MSEKVSRIFRGKDHLTIAKLTQEEISERVVIAVGDNCGELQPPYPTDEFGQFSLSVLDYLANWEKLIRINQGDYSHLDGRLQFPGQRLFEVVGMNSGACVAYAVSEIINGGGLAYVQSKLITDLHARSSRKGVPYSDYTNGRIVINEVLRGQPQNYCIIPARETLVFGRMDN